jgi:predicted DNA-binding transcriptional regulator YafY
MIVRDKMERMRKIQHQSLPGWNEGNYKKKNFRIARIQSIFELDTHTLWP